MSCGDFDWNNELYITFTDPFFTFWRIIIKEPFVLNGFTTLLATPLYFSSSRSSSVFTYNQSETTRQQGKQMVYISFGKYLFLQMIYIQSFQNSRLFITNEKTA